MNNNATKYLATFLLLCACALAQVTVQITGTVLDVANNPYQLASGRAVLVSGNGSGQQAWTTGNTNPVQSPIILNNTDSFGRFTTAVTSTAIIDQQAADPVWVFSFTANQACQPQVSFTMNALALTSNQDISTQIQAQAAMLPASCTPASSGTFINLFARNFESIRFPDQFPGANVGAKIQAADSDCGSASCVIWSGNQLPNITTTSNNLPTSPSINRVFIDTRSRTYLTNPQQTAFNVTDGLATSDWLNINTGGFPRSKLYVGYSPPTGENPGDAAAIFATVAFPGILGVGGSNAEWGSVSLLETSGGTDTRTNQGFLVANESEVSIIGTGVHLYDVRAESPNIIGGTPASSGDAGRLNSLVIAGQGSLPSTGFHVAQWSGIYGLDGSLNTVNQNTLSGVATCVNGSATCTRVSGDFFYDNAMPTRPIVIDGVTYIVNSVSNAAQTITLSISYGGTTDNHPWVFTGNQYAAVYEGNFRLIANSNRADTQGGGGILADVQSGNGILSALWIRDRSNQYVDGTYFRAGLQVTGTGTDGSLVLLNKSGDGVFSIDLNNGNFSPGGKIVSAINTGVSPFTIVSTTVNANLNADFLDGFHAGNASTGHAMCWKDATHMGNCSSVVASDGTCTCN